MVAVGYDKVNMEKYDEAAKEHNNWKRTAGMSMDMFVHGLKKRKILWMAKDGHSVISDNAFANRMLSESGLTHSQRMQACFNTGS